MRKRLLSLLLALCMLVGILPTPVFAAKPEEALYAQMLELGLVDAEGALIEDNTFTVEDGTRLSSLTELIEWLNQCDESDLDTIITVDETGRSATVEQFMYALIIEYQMADVAGQLNLLASGEYATTLAADSGAVPSYVHDMRLGMVISRSGSILTLEVCLTDKGLTGKEYTAPYDIPVEVGMFADFLAAYSEDYAADENSVVPCTNSFRTYTTPQGSSSIEFKMDLNKLRANYLSKHEGLWDGNAYMFFQARTTVNDSGISDKMPYSTATYCVSIAPSSEADPIVNAITGGTSIGMNDDDKGEVVPYRLSWSGDGTTTPVNDEDCFAFTVDIPAARDSYSASSFGWKNYFGRALQVGVGDPDDPKVNLENVTIWTGKKLSDNEVKSPDFYAEIENDDGIPEDNDFVQITDLAFYYQQSSEEDFKNSATAAGRTLLELTRVHLNHWYDDTSYDSQVTDNSLFKDIAKKNKQLTNFYNVEVPVYSPNKNVVNFPQKWYLNVDWIEQNGDQNLQPNEILMYGDMTIVDETAPTIESIDTCARSPVYTGSTSYNYSYFRPGNYIPIVVTFSEPVYGDYQLAYLDGTETKYLSSTSGVPAFQGDVTRNGATLSNTRVFYYYVNSTDSTGLQVLGVKPVDENACKDVYGNKFKAATDVDYKPYGDGGVMLLDGHIQGGALNHSILSMTATPDAQDPNEVTFRVNLDNLTQFKQDWKAWSDADSDDPVISVRVDLGYNGVQTVDLTLAKEGTGSDEVYYLTGTMSLPVAWSDTERVAELYYDDSPLYGVYATFTQKMFVFAGMDSFTINIDGGWPSGIENTIFKQDSSLLTLSVTDNDKDYSNGRAMVASAPVVKLQSREYLDAGDRVWLGGDSGISLVSLDESNKLDAIQTNAYPFSTPMLSDDGKIFVYLSDADSTDVTDVEVRYSLSNGGSFPDDGTAIPDDGFSGCGDSSLDFDGTEDFAGAVWLREAATTGLKAGAVLDESQQTVLLNGLEVVASIWDGDEWATTRLTDNGSQEFEPVIAVNSAGKAIAVWRSVQTDENAYTFSQNRILCKIFNGTSWSDEYTLYNGSAGEVTGMTAEMLADGTAAVAFSVNNENEGSDIYYTVVNTAAANPEDSAKTIRATTNSYTDENPQLIAVGNQFVLGWSSVQSLTGVDQRDVGLRVFNSTGAPQSRLPESLSDMVSTAAFDGQFTFVKGADSLEKLSLLWNDSKAGSQDNDVIRAIKFVSYEGSYISSAATEVAELPARTGLDHMDACVTSGNGTEIQAVLQGTTYSDTEFDEVNYSYELDGQTYSGKGYIPKEEVNLLSATGTYADAVEVVSTTVDYTTLATDSYVPVNFTVANQGINVINSVTIQLDGAEPQTFSGLTLLPGQAKAFSVVAETGSEIRDLDYSVEAIFQGGQKPQTTGTVYLDYPDVGISALTVTKEQDGLRMVLANLYNQSAASLNKSDRRVVLGVYSDPECDTPLDGKYFTGGTTDKPYEMILTGNTLAAIDDTGYTQEIAFRIGDYVKDAKLEEIPDGGVTLFVKARIEQKVDGEWITLPEADSQNNQKYLTFDSLLTRSENAPTTLSVEMENGDTTTANVQVRNNSLQPCTSGNLVAALLDNNGNLLETKNVDKLTLGAEEVAESRIDFSTSGARVVLRYGEAESGSSPSNADATSITIDGLSLTLDSFNGNGSAVVENVSAGRYLLTVIPEDDGATVTVNGEPAENGMATITCGPVARIITVTITAADGSTARTYTICLNPDPSSNSGSGGHAATYYTLNFETNGGSAIAALRKSSGTTVDLTAYTPTRGGYIFTGWYADKALTEKITQVKLTGNTTVYAGWQEAEAGAEIEASPFTDVPEGSYYEEAVNWAVAQGITAGTTATTFSPNAVCTRAQAVMFLWKAAGSPAPMSSVMPFTDVPEGSYYHDAVLWAVENGVTKGTSDTAFSPNAICSRAQIVSFLWRSQKSPAAGAVNPFTDVAENAYYADAVLWAVENGITAGTTDTTFSPNANCTRAQIVTFLWKALAE